MSFAADVRRFALSTRIRSDQVVRKVTIDLTSDLVRMTPVDTGHARSNWFFGFQPVVAQDNTNSKNGGPSVRRGLEFAKDLKGGAVFYISNSVEYIMVLEFGHSKQAPQGMARITAARWQAYVDGALKQGTQSGRLESMRGGA